MRWSQCGHVLCGYCTRIIVLSLPLGYQYCRQWYFYYLLQTCLYSKAVRSENQGYRTFCAANFIVLSWNIPTKFQCLYGRASLTLNVFHNSDYFCRFSSLPNPPSHLIAACLECIAVMAANTTTTNVLRHKKGLQLVSPLFTMVCDVSLPGMEPAGSDRVSSFPEVTSNTNRTVSDRDKKFHFHVNKLKAKIFMHFFFKYRYILQVFS